MNKSNLNKRKTFVWKPTYEEQERTKRLLKFFGKATVTCVTVFVVIVFTASLFLW